MARGKRGGEGNGGRGLHVIGERNLAVLVADDWEAQRGAGDLVDIVDPSAVRLNGIGGQTNQLDAALPEFGLVFGQGGELGGADWSVIFGVREENDPLIADELVKIDVAVGRLGLEVWGDGAKAQARVIMSGVGQDT